MVPVAQETTANTVRLPYSFSRRFSLVAWCEASLEILHVHPLSLSVLQELQRGLNAPFTLRQIDEAEFEQRLNAVWQRDSSEARQLMEDLGSAEDFFTLAEELPETEDLLESDDDAPIIKLINAMLAEAIKEGASDIHIETFEKSLVIRFRVDGTLHEMLRPGRKLASLLVSRIKVMARLDIAEKRVPQDGRIALLLGGRAIDVRVSTMPSAWGGTGGAATAGQKPGSPDAGASGFESRTDCAVAPAVTQTARHFSGDGADRFRQKHHAVRWIAGAEQPLA